MRVPVIAAGGIGDARGIAAALSPRRRRGAARHRLSPLPRSDHFSRRTARCSRSGAPTVFTNLLTGGLARGFAGRLVRELGPVRADAPPYPLAAAALAPIRAAAEAEGRIWLRADLGRPGARLGEALPARDLTRKLAAEALALLGRGA